MVRNWSSRRAESTESLANDLAAIARIDAVPTMLEVICRSTGLGFCAIARVTEDRWIACAVRDEIEFGLTPGGELEVRTTICDAIRKSGEAVVIDDATEDTAYRNHPTPKMYGFRSYISMPIRRGDGKFWGTLCAIDPRPARVSTPHVTGMFALFADLIAFHLDAQERVALSRTALLNERETAELREQFIAVLAHDLADPLSAIGIGARLLTDMPLGAKARTLASMIRDSVARMGELIDQVTDFARGRLGGGLSLARVPVVDLEPALAHVVREMQTAWPDRTIDASISIDGTVICDRGRMAQLFTNLLANAVKHGDPAQPVRVCARRDDSGFELSVANAGPAIPADIMQQLFLPFSRGGSRGHRKGLGLGLYIASEIAREHGGSLSVVSTSDETRFTFRMPHAR
jgi:signal transduction histidine kinase